MEGWHWLVLLVILMTTQAQHCTSTSAVAAADSWDRANINKTTTSSYECIATGSPEEAGILMDDHSFRRMLATKAMPTITQDIGRYPDATCPRHLNGRYDCAQMDHDGIKCDSYSREPSCHRK